MKKDPSFHLPYRPSIVPTNEIKISLSVGPKISTIPNTDTLVATATVPRYIYKDRYARALYKDFKEQEKSARGEIKSRFKLVRVAKLDRNCKKAPLIRIEFLIGPKRFLFIATRCSESDRAPFQ